MPPRSDLTLLAISAVCIVVAALSSNEVIDVIAGLPLTAYLPGVALVSIIAPQRHYANAVERQVWIVGASFGLSVLGGILLNLVGGLTRSSWLIWIASVIVVSVALKQVLARRFSGHPTELMSVSASGHGVADSRPGLTTTTVQVREDPVSSRVTLRQVILLLAAGAVCVAAMVLSIHTNAVTTKESFVQAWVLPRPTDDVASTSVQLGLQNNSGERRTYLVDVNVGSIPTRVFSVLLDNGASWTQVITRRPGERVESTVYGLVKPWGEIVLAKVYLATPVA